MNEARTIDTPQIDRFAASQGQPLRPGQDFAQYLKDYARERPEAAALWCVGLGFILGWKLKPW